MSKSAAPKNPATMSVTPVTPPPTTAQPSRLAAACGAVLAFAHMHWPLALWLLATLAWAAWQTGSIFLSTLALGLAALYLLLQSLARLWRPGPPLAHLLGRWLLWALACAAVWGITQWREAQLRAQADAAVAALWQWHGQHQRFPPHLPPLNPPPGARLHYGFDRQGQPYLFYCSAWSGFDTWHYDFAQRQWRFQPD